MHVCTGVAGKSFGQDGKLVVEELKTPTKHLTGVTAAMRTVIIHSYVLPPKNYLRQLLL